ncbi:MAG: P-loop NTPase, partial [Candidatus Omnitrophica bacterium]|nr:P-loop NTPase [Candidatus Omnitrophota bacterium]
MNISQQPPNSGLTGVKKIIAVSSCKGGVGKSTIAAHLAMEMIQKGHTVGLLDADIFGPSIPALFQLQHVPLLTDERNFIKPVEHNGLKLMSFGFLLGDSPAVMRGPIVTRYIQQLLLQCAWDDLDYLFVDMPPGTGDVHITITQTIPLNGTIIVTTPQSLSIIDVTRGILMFEKMKVPILGIIENMSYIICPKCEHKHAVFEQNTQQTLQKRFGVPLLGDLPLTNHFAQHIEKSKGEGGEAIQTILQNTLDSIDKLEGQNKQLPKVRSNNATLQVTFFGESETHQKKEIDHLNLRIACQCALCVDEMNGRSIIDKAKIPKDIKPTQINPLGNYAVNIVWSDGHSSSIYSY